jgi:hypothetical protein
MQLYLSRGPKSDRKDNDTATVGGLLTAGPNAERVNLSLSLTKAHEMGTTEKVTRHGGTSGGSERVGQVPGKFSSIFQVVPMK